MQVSSTCIHPSEDNTALPTAGDPMGTAVDHAQKKALLLCDIRVGAGVSPWNSGILTDVRLEVAAVSVLSLHPN